jgi:CheY-like chemotaxis protein
MIKLKKIMIIDDDDIFVFVITKVLRHSDLIDILQVLDNGLDALNFFKNNVHNYNVLPDIILLDLNMPILDGWQFLNEYCKISPSIAKCIEIYVCSSSISPTDIAKTKTINEVTDYLIKPISKEIIIEILRR